MALGEQMRDSAQAPAGNDSRPRPVAPPMQNQSSHLLLPSALVLCDLMEAHAGNPPIEVLEQAGFRRHEASEYLQRRAGATGCLANAKSRTGIHSS
jgi:hypothetical protein